MSDVLDRLANAQLVSRLETVESELEWAFKALRADGQEAMAAVLDEAVANVRMVLFDLDAPRRRAEAGTVQQGELCGHCEHPQSKHLAGGVGGCVDRDELNYGCECTAFVAPIPGPFPLGEDGLPCAACSTYERCARHDKSTETAGLPPSVEWAVTMWDDVRPFYLTAEWAGVTAEERATLNRFTDLMDEATNVLLHGIPAERSEAPSPAVPVVPSDREAGGRE